MLVDYNNLEVFIPITEINRKKFNITTFFKPETIYPALVYSIDNNLINISYSKIKKEKKEKLLKSFEIQTIIVKFIKHLENKFSPKDILNPVHIDISDLEQPEVEKIYQKILLNPNEITTNIDIIAYINQNKKIIKPIYSQSFTLIVIEPNGLEILKTILNELNKKYDTKIIASPLYSIEFDDFTKHDDIKTYIIDIVSNYKTLFEMTEFEVIRELEIKF